MIINLKSYIEWTVEVAYQHACRSYGFVAVVIAWCHYYKEEENTLLDQQSLNTDITVCFPVCRIHDPIIPKSSMGSVGPTKRLWAKTLELFWWRYASTVVLAYESCPPRGLVCCTIIQCKQLPLICVLNGTPNGRSSQSSGAVSKSRWPSWVPQFTFVAAKYFCCICISETTVLVNLRHYQDILQLHFGPLWD